MRLAVLADIHGNLVALESVLAHLEANGSAERLWVLGDLAAFGYAPGEAIERVRGLPDVAVIQGNTDRYLSELYPAKDEPGSEEGHKAALRWGCDRLTGEQAAYLRDLPGLLSLEVDGFGTLTGFHAVPGDDEFVLSPGADESVVRDKLRDVPAGVALMGHTHLPVDRRVDAWRVVNVGSVGMPFDGDPRASYALLDIDDAGALDLSLRRVAYDVDQAVNLLHTSGYPAAEFQAARLHAGLSSPTS